MRIVSAGAASALLFVAWPAMAQTADFKCPPAGTVVKYSSGTQVTWQQQVGKACRLLIKQSNGREDGGWFYAPAAYANDRNNKAWADQDKPENLWPLTVGKTYKAFYRGEGQTPGYVSQWNNYWTVEKYEKVTTKAGTFDAFVVTWQSDQLPPSTWRSTLRQWYAPSEGVIVKSDYQDNQGGGRKISEAMSIRRP